MSGFRFNISSILREVTYKATKSSGPGGQHVNKVNTCIELSFDILNSEVLTTKEKHQLNVFLKNRISSNGILKLTAQHSRSQIQNKDAVTERFLNLLNESLKPRKRRVKTKPTRASELKRLEKKRHLSEKKKRRKLIRLV